MSDGILERAVTSAEAWRTSADPEAFEEEVLPALRPLLERATTTNSADALAEWLEAFSIVAGAADEELATSTSDLIRQSPEAATEARGRLSYGARVRLTLFLEEWADDTPDVVGFRETFQHQWSGRTVSAALADTRPTLVTFAGEGTFTSSRGFPVVEGTMTVLDRAGNVAGTYHTNTGGGASTFRRTNGPVPPGTYLVSNFRLRDKFGMVKNGIGYSLDLDPVAGTAVYGRSLFRIHPDGASRGTNGCLGVDEAGNALAGSRDLLKALSDGGAFLASVAYAGLG